MPATNASAIHDVDASELREAVLDTVEGDLYSLVEFDRHEFNTLYASDATLAMYEDESHMAEHFERIHGYVNLDLAEMELFTRELIPVASEVRAITTTLDVLKLVRAYVGDRGYFLALDPAEPVDPVLSAIASVVG